MGLQNLEILKGVSGDIVTLAGFDKAKINHTITNSEIATHIPIKEIDPPIISLVVAPNQSPMAKPGKDVKNSFFDLKKRFLEEADRDLALKVIAYKNSIEVQGRGDLHLSTILENMRRENYQF